MAYKTTVFPRISWHAVKFAEDRALLIAGAILHHFFRIVIFAFFMTETVCLNKATRILFTKPGGSFHLQNSGSEFTGMQANAGKCAKIIIKIFSFI